MTCSFEADLFDIGYDIEKVNKSGFKKYVTLKISGIGGPVLSKRRKKRLYLKQLGKIAPGKDFFLSFHRAFWYM